MRTRRSIWSTLTIGLALIAAIAIASPALGGPSLRSLVKKEVTKQISGKTGPGGPAGAAGANGAQGPGALRLTYSRAEGDLTERSLGTIDGFEVRAFCGTTGTGPALVMYFSLVGGGTIHGISNTTNDDEPLIPGIIAQHVDPNPAQLINTLVPDSAGDFARSFIQATVTHGAGEISLQLYTVANDGGAGSCEIHGTAVPSR